jgi:hypothetical protein
MHSGGSAEGQGITNGGPVSVGFVSEGIEGDSVGV